MWFIVFLVVALIAAVVLAITASGPRAEQKQPESFQQPTAEEGNTIPVLFGTRLISKSNVVWFGDVEAVPIRKKGGK
jgi:uncharacterized protein YdeI (BOF family)